MASWGNKLEQRLSPASLADSASKESIQALAKWVGFNRKHASVIANTLAEALQTKNNSEMRQWLYWQVIHEVLVLDVGTSKWERLLELRSTIGEAVIIPSIEALRASGSLVAADKVEGLVKQWDENNVFGGPTLVSQIRRLLSSESKTQPAKPAITSPTKAENPPAAPIADSVKPPTPAKQEVETSPGADEGISTLKAKSPQLEDKDKIDDAKPVEKRSSLSHLAKEVSYDFEAKGIPYAKTDSRDFLGPCKAIATLQIARDLRSDAAVQLSSLLSSIPDDIQQACQDAQKKQAGGETVDLPKDVARDFSIRVDETLLDMDMDEQIQNIRTFRDIVERQREARKQLIFLLVQSRCQFGSREAAEKFHKCESYMQLLKKRKDILSDAMALEGLDFDPEAAGNTTALGDLEPLTWYEAEGEETPNKRLKIENLS